MVDSSQTRLAAIAETSYGVTPTTPAFQIYRMKGEGLNANIDNVVSDEIRADRNVTDLIQVGSNVGGNVDFELSYGTFDTFLESLMFSAWATNVLKNGNTQKSLTIEKLFEAGATDQYHRFTGCVANTMSLSIEAQKIVTGSFGFLGKVASDAQAIISGATYVAANSNPVISASTNFAALGITGVTSPRITKLDLNITNNLRQQPVVGSLYGAGLGTGRFEVTGNLTAYFDDATLYDLFLAGTNAPLTFQLGGTSAKRYQFDIGSLKFETGKVVAGAKDQDVMAEMTFRGLFNGTDNTLQITRAP